MAVALVFAGILLLMTSINGTQRELSRQIRKSFTGSGNFWYWIGGILIIAILAKATSMQQTGRLLITLIIAVYIVSQKGIFAKVEQALSGAGGAEQEAPIAQTGAARPISTLEGGEAFAEKLPKKGPSSNA